MIYIATITEVHLNPDGLPIFSATDENNNTYYPCAFTSPLAGFDGRFAQPSVSEGTKVILIAHGEGYIRSFYAVAYLVDPEDSLSISVDGVRTALEAEAAAGRLVRTTPDVADDREDYERNADYDGTHIEDMHLEVQDSFVNMSLPHGLTLQGYPRVSVQIPEDAGQAAFRVSAGGNASNFVLNAVPHLNRLFTYLGQLEAKVLALETALAASMTAQATTLAAEAALKNAAAAGSGAADAANATAVTNAQTALSAVPAPGPAATVRQESDQDVNAYVIIP